MSSAPSPVEIAADATWLAQAMDVGSGQTRLIRMQPEDYRDESFLDDRMFQRQMEGHIVSWETAVAGLADARDDARWIFHIGHVGSTLISRLIGELDNVLSLREPRILRDLAGSPGPIDGYLPGLRPLLSRTFAPDEAVVVKATSFVSELADRLVSSGAKALFVYADPLAYLGTCLAGENTMREVAALAQLRAQRMAGRVSLGTFPDRPAYQVAAAWACEMTSLEKAAEALPEGAIQWLDFDHFLGSVAPMLRRSAEFLGIAATANAAETIARGPLLSRYSKALEYDYSPGLRRELIAEAHAEHADGIRGALAMLSGAAQDSPLLARALDRSATER